MSASAAVSLERESPPPGIIPGLERSLAIVIGINAYSHGLRPLQNAASDARSVADVLERQGFEVLRYLDSDASLANLSHLLSKHLPSLAPAPDRVIIYFAGHGLAHTDASDNLSGFLLPADAQKDTPSTYWPMAEVREALRKLHCRHLLLVLDCCFAGAFPHALTRDLQPLSEEAPLYLERFRHCISHRSFQALLSTAHDEAASDRLHSKPLQETLGGGKHSPFAETLLAALQSRSTADGNGDGLLTITELYTFLRRKLSSLPRGAQQTPALWNMDWHEGGEFLFLLGGAFPTLPSAAPLSHDANPYRGLSPFSSEQRELFFGREALVDEILKQIRSSSLLVLRAPSGAGKTSFVHAGLIPRLTHPDVSTGPPANNGASPEMPWDVPPTLRPSAEPLQQLSAWLAGLAPDAPTQGQLVTRPQLAASFIESYLSHPAPAPLLLVVDPLEELVTTCTSPVQRRAFLQALAALLELRHEALHLLLLLRSDFEPHFDALLPPSLHKETWSSSTLLPRMSRDDLRRCIEKPAEARTLFFAPGLVDQLLDDLEQTPVPLPLLSVSLSALFDAYIHRGSKDRTLSMADYEAIGTSVSGAIHRRADLLFTQARPELQHTMRNVLLRMVSFESGGPTRRRVPRAELEYADPEENTRVQSALDLLTDARLVVSSNANGACFELAHDTLLTSWTRLHGWAHRAHGTLALLSQLSLATQQWQRQGHLTAELWSSRQRLGQVGLPSSSLTRPAALLQLPTSPQLDQPGEPLTLNAAESRFLRASAAHRRAVLTAGWALGITLAIVLAGLVVEAMRKDRLALTRAQLSLAEQLLSQDPTKARLLLLEIFRDELPEEWSSGLQTTVAATQQLVSAAILSGGSGPVQEAMVSSDDSRVILLDSKGVARLHAVNGAEQARLLGDPKRLVAQAALSPQGALLLRYTDGTVHLGSVDGARAPLVLGGERHRAENAWFSAHGTQVITLSRDHELLVWPAEGMGPPLLLGRSGQPVVRAWLSPQATHVLALSTDGSTSLWSVEGNDPPQFLHGSEGKIDRVFLSGDGSLVLVTYKDKDSLLWNVHSQERPRVIPGHKARLRHAVFSHDGLQLLTICTDGQALLRRVDHVEEFQVLEDGSRRALDASFSPDDTWVLTGHADGTALLRRPDSPAPALVLQGHTDGVTFTAFSKDGSFALTASKDGTARVWGLDEKKAPLLPRDHTSRIREIAFAPGGSHILSASSDGPLHLWRADGSERPLILQDHQGPVLSLDFSADGSRLVTASADDSIRLWRSDGATPPLRLGEHDGPIASVHISPDGGHVLARFARGPPLLWRIEGTAIVRHVLGGLDGRVEFASFSPDGQQIVTIAEGMATHLWRTATPREPLVLKDPEGATLAAFSPDGRHLATAARDGTVRIWRTDGTGEPLVCRSHASQLRSLVFNRSGSVLLTTSEDGIAYLWSRSGEGRMLAPRGRPSMVTTASFSPDGLRVFTGHEDGTVRRWSTDGAELLPALEGHDRDVQQIIPSADGLSVLTVSKDGSARLWSAEGHGVSLVLKPAGGLRQALLAPDGSRVVTLSEKYSLQSWPLRPQDALELLRDTTTVCLSGSERERYLGEPPDEARRAHARCSGRRP